MALVSFSAVFEFELMTYRIDKADDPLNVGGHRSDLDIPIPEQLGVVFDERDRLCGLVIRR
jgi:hypothetical protein